MTAVRQTGIWTRTALLAALLVAPAAAQVITRVSVDSTGAQADYGGTDPAISGDGLVVGFTGYATNLVPGDTNNQPDVFVHDRSTGITERVSVSSSGVQGDYESDLPALSHDGLIVAFESFASKFAGQSYGENVFVHDRTTGKTEMVSVSTGGAPGDDWSMEPAISADGNIVVFQSYANDFWPYDRVGTLDIFYRDRKADITDIVSISSSGAAGNGGSSHSAISADGNFVVFQSFATNFAASDTNGKPDIFIRDRSKKTTHRLSTSTAGVQADADCTSPAISGDGSIVAWCSAATTLVAGDTNAAVDVFLRDRNTATTERVSVDSYGAEGNGDSFGPKLSSDGRFVTFGSYSSNLDPRDTDSKPDLFLHDRVTGTTRLLTINQVLDPANRGSFAGAISDDGGIVALVSVADNLVLGDTNATLDIFAVDLTVPPVVANWSNYGSGYPGTLGVPTLTLSANPVFGTTISIDASNSSGLWSEGFVPVGLSSTDLPTSAGGHLLVDPLYLLLLPLLPGGRSIVTAIPKELELYGVTLFFQVIEIDPGAQHGLSFTPGLQFTIGQ